MKYYIRNNFFVRATSESISNYEMIRDLDAGKVSIENIVDQNLELVESIAIASSELYHAIKERKFNDNQSEAIMRYYIRSMVRPTPYGAFAGISRGEFCDSTNLIKGKEKNKYCTVDSEWFYKLVNRYEEKLLLFDELKVKFNNQCIIREDLLINPYICNGYNTHMQQSNTNMITAKYSKQVESVKNIANQWVKYGDLKSLMFQLNPNVDEDIILRFLNNLVKNEILITECRTPISNQDFLGLLLERVEKGITDKEICDLMAMLKKINTKCVNYNNGSSKIQILEYEELVESMEDVIENKNYLNVISGFDLAHNALSIKVKEKLEEFIPFMILDAKESNENIYLHAYKRKFIENYGEYREIALLDLLDEHNGLGNPYSMNGVNSSVLDNKKNSIKNFLENKICLGLKKGMKRVNISKSEFKLALSNESESMLECAKSFELNFKIYASCKDDIDKGEFEIEFAPCGGSDGAGKMINRFYNVLDKTGKDELKEIYNLIQNDLYSDVDNSDITYYPKQGRISNLCNGNRNYKYAIDIGVDSVDGQIQIDLNDIVVGYDRIKNRLYLKSIKTGKRIRVNSDNMLMYTIDNHIVHFLRDVSFSNELHPAPFITYLEEFHLKYIPQVNLDNIILLPETWKMEKSDFRNITSYNIFVEDFKKKQNDWGIPKKIYIIDSDNYLLLDLSIDICWKYLFSETKKILKTKDFYYIKKGESDEQLWFCDADCNYYQAEFVVECLAEKEEIKEDILQEFPQTISDIEANRNKVGREVERNIFVGKEGWIYFKIYLDEFQSDEILINEIMEFLNVQRNLNIVEKFFFIRYADPQFHIRLRIKMSSNGNLVDIIEWLEKLKSREKYNRYEISVYEREIERYGGVEIYEYAENVFCADSIFVCDLIRKMGEKDDAALLGVYSILKTVFNSTVECEEFLNQIVDHKKFRNDFKKKSQYYIGLLSNIENIFNDKNLRETHDLREESIETYFTVVMEQDKKNTLTNTIKDILLSITHMFCNRLKGDVMWEHWIYAMLRHSLHVINQKEKYMVKEDNENSREKKYN